MQKILISFLLLSLSACTLTSSSKKTENPNALTSSSLVPAAQGEVKTKLDSNGNTQLNVRVKHLAQPDRIKDGANSYVVWVMPVGQQEYQNIGALKVNKNLEGTYQTKIPHKSFNLIVTPESSINAQAPSGVTVLEKNITL